MTKTNKFTNILELVKSGAELDLIVNRLTAINNSYSISIVNSLLRNDYQDALEKLQSSVAFEIMMNKKNPKKRDVLDLTTKEIQARIQRDILINGVSKEIAIELAYLRADRLRNGLKSHNDQATMTGYGHFMTEA